MNGEDEQSTCDVASRTSFNSSGDEDGRKSVLWDQTDRASHWSSGGAGRLRRERSDKKKKKTTQVQSQREALQRDDRAVHLMKLHPPHECWLWICWRPGTRSGVGTGMNSGSEQVLWRSLWFLHWVKDHQRTRLFSAHETVNLQDPKDPSSGSVSVYSSTSTD